ncbi:hypothetical protein BJ166DRAFT_227387 [Pestalotiopsis sp. NC0098]|nr:hypothetical protein BJ166DRAFT_227387 [Pestalotiopsis sp. NC0098]
MTDDTGVGDIPAYGLGVGRGEFRPKGPSSYYFAIFPEQGSSVGEDTRESQAQRGYVCRRGAPNNSLHGGKREEARREEGCHCATMLCKIGARHDDDVFFLGPVVNHVLGVFFPARTTIVPGKIIVPTRRSARVHVHTCCVTIHGIPWSLVRMLFFSHYYSKYML